MAGTGKRELEIRPFGTTSMRVVAWKGGGELPKDLSGLYTNDRIAQEAIDKYMSSKVSRTTNA